MRASCDYDDGKVKLEIIEIFRRRLVLLLPSFAHYRLDDQMRAAVVLNPW